MDNVAYVNGLENFIMKYLKPCRKIPINLVFLSFNIEIPESLKTEDITLGDFINQSVKKL